MGVTHLTFDFCFRHQCCYGVNDNDIHRTGAHQHVGDFQRLLTRVWLGNVEIIDIDTQFTGVLWIQSVFRIDKGTGSALPLGLGDNTER